MQHNNIFTYLLEHLGVKHTKKYSSTLYSEHPHKKNMYGLSNMLSEYKICSKGVKIEDTNTLLNIDPPYIAQLNTDLVTVSELTMKNVTFLRDDGICISTSFQDFLDKWTGFILLAESNDDSIEPNYKINRQKEGVKQLEHICLVGGIIALIIFGFLYNNIFLDLGALLSLTINVIGVYIAYLLVLSSFRIKNNRADKICHSVKNGDCNSVLNSQGAKFLGLYGWSEIGMSYFISNILIVLLFPHLITYMVYINVCALPYSIWSVWYQKSKVQKWCPLCLIVQVMIWVLFLNNLLFHSLRATHLYLSDIITVVCIYLIPFLIINLISNNKSTQLELKYATYKLNTIKYIDGIFLHILQKQEHFSVKKSSSNILFGNKDSDVLITILINPLCKACGETHKKIIQLLDKNDNIPCIQYQISGVSENTKPLAKILIGVYVNNTNDKILAIYNEWFESGRYNIDNFCKKYNVYERDQETNIEIANHILWMEQNNFPAAPLILINGYELPIYYDIKDIENFILSND